MIIAGKVNILLAIIRIVLYNLYQQKTCPIYIYIHVCNNLDFGWLATRYMFPWKIYYIIQSLGAIFFGFWIWFFLKFKTKVLYYAGFDKNKEIILGGLFIWIFGPCKGLECFNMKFLAVIIIIIIVELYKHYFEETHTQQCLN